MATQPKRLFKRILEAMFYPLIWMAYGILATWAWYEAQQQRLVSPAVLAQYDDL